MSNHHSNFVLEGAEKMDKCEVIGILDTEGYEKENRVYNGGGCVLLYWLVMEG